MTAPGSRWAGSSTASGTGKAASRASRSRRSMPERAASSGPWPAGNWARRPGPAPNSTVRTRGSRATSSAPQSGRRKAGSCNQLGGSRAAEEHPQELVGHRLEVVCPLENDDILFQVYFVHTPERPEEIPQPGPDPLQRVAMDLADAITVVIPRELASVMVDRRVPPAA